ncbi:hypothetical protein D3C75_1213910 [compost metagenome]
MASGSLEILAEPGRNFRYRMMMLEELLMSVLKPAMHMPSPGAVWPAMVIFFRPLMPKPLLS